MILGGVLFLVGLVILAGAERGSWREHWSATMLLSGAGIMLVTWAYYQLPG